MQDPSRPIPVFIQLPGNCTFEVIDVAGPLVLVGQLKDAVIAKFKLDSAPQQLQLFKLNGSSSSLLAPSQTLAEAGLLAGTKLAVAIVGQGTFNVQMSLLRSLQSCFFCTPKLCSFVRFIGVTRAETLHLHLRG
jgi:hypothetical protein